MNYQYPRQMYIIGRNVFYSANKDFNQGSEIPSIYRDDLILIDHHKGHYYCPTTQQILDSNGRSIAKGLTTFIKRAIRWNR